MKFTASFGQASWWRTPSTSGFLPRTLPQTTSQGPPEVRSWHLHRIRKSHIYIQTDFCVSPVVSPSLTKRETASETTAVLIVRNVIDIWLWSTAWQRQSQPKCVLGETNKETRKYKYGAVRSRDHIKTTQHVKACVDFDSPNARCVRHRRMRVNAAMRRCLPPLFLSLPPTVDPICFTQNFV